MMELPSMVQRSGDTLIVRSVVSGNQLYLDQGGVKGSIGAASNSNNLAGAVTHNPSTNSHHYHHNSSTSALEQQFEMYRAAAAAAQQQQQHYLQQQHQQQQQGGTHTTAQQQANAAALELKDEGLPQCKIKRNYSCSYCTYFTQNPRYHLTHLRDVHGEKIVINNCKLCLYASRHFQKLVRHMKMVHGCTDGIAGGHGQSRGKRGMSREARKRKLEQSVGIGGGVGGGVGMANAASSSVPEMPTLEEVKRELELQQAAFNKQQANHKTQQMLANQMTTNAIIAAYEQELRERKLESLKVRSTYEHQEAALPANIEAQRQRQSPTINNNSYNNGNNNGGNVVSGFQLPLTKRNLELSPSPTGSASSPSPAAVGGTGTPSSSSTPTPHNTSAALSLSYADEPPQNRLLKCSICDFTTLYRAQLMTHELDEHCKTKFFRCEKCSYVTHIKTRFSKHVKYHSMPMIKCVTCDFRTPYKWNLDRHMKNHGGAGPFKCAACDFTADIKQSLTVHEMNHHVPPVGHAAGMSLARRRNKVGGTDLCEDFLSDSAEMMEDHYNNNNLDEYDEAMLATDGDGDPDGMIVAESYSKKCKYNDDEEPTDLSQKGGSSDTSSVHNQALTPKAKRPVPNLIPIPKVGNNVLNLSKDLAASRSSLTDIASMFFSEKQLSEMLQPLDKSDAPQLSPTTTITSSSSHNSRSLLHKKPGSFFDKLKSSALTNSGGPSENLICPCGHMAKCLSESIIHRKTCNFAAIADDDIEVEEEEQDDGEGRLEIDFAADDDDKQSHSALNLVTGSTRCQHCRHRCKSSADLLNHLKHCTEAARCGNESYDSLSGESSTGRGGADSAGEQLQHPMENRVFIWNKMPRGGSSAAGGDGSQCSDGQHRHSMGESSAGSGSSGGGMGNNEENSYYGVETAPGYGEVTKKMTPEEEAANSSLKKVYKCPHCSFWASTASRFHVHIVGHLNKKPFECSLCSYRSNWRWDITKHIRLKTIRDPSHKNARVLMNDETGRRNYTKYNKYITLMKVTEEDGDPKLMKSGEMTPNQVASLSFLNDFNKTSGVHLNGLRDDVTLEPVHTPKSSTSTDATDAGAEQMSDRFIRLPLLATMVNAAMTQHQQQQKKQHEQQHTTLITPSVTISAVKRSPPHLLKPSDDLVTDVKQEGNEKKTFYRCRKCSFRHGNRDAVLAHVRIHYQDSSYASALATSSKSAAANGAQQPLQVAVNSNLYNMNEVLAAMCLSQQQQQQQNSNSPSSNAQQQQQQQQQHSILSAGLLQQAMQSASSASPNSPLSGLALALTGKSPTKSGNAATAATILEHGEQKASQNEASAPRRPPPTSPNTHTQAASIATAAPNGGSAFGGNVAGATSLQHLLSSPRDSTHHTHALAHAHNRPLSSPPATTTTLIGAGINYNQNNNSNLVMGLTGAGAGAASSNANSPTAQQQQLASSSSCLSASPQSPTSAAGSPIVTTFPTTPTGSGAAAAAATTPLSAKRMGAFGAAPRLHAHNALPAGVSGMQGLIAGDSVCFGGLVYGSNSSTLLQCNSTTTTITTTPSTTISTPSTSTTSCNLLSNSSAAATALAAKNPSSSNASSSSSSTSSPSSSTSATNFINNNNNLNNSHNMNNSNNASNSNNLLSNDSERRDPSPYRCGHCHQVSNWKHVIQRHCRLKHAGDIRIETLDRAACVERNAAPIYRPLGSGASNETNYGLSFKALQHQQQQQPPPPSPHHQQQQQQQQKTHANLNNKSNNNNSVLMSKHNEHMLHSPLTSSAAAAAVNAASTPQDLQAAAAYLAAAYKAAHANAASGAGTAEELLLQQNDQIEITRLPATAATNLVQLLESANASVGATQPNSKCKQQKCPLCPYISESKSQMNYHISLHKPTQYECQLCTFVCAKKQHLSNHMRSVHHQQQHSSGGATAQSHNLNLDFSMALQLAAAAQAQQDAAALNTPLAIDLSALKHTTLSTGGQCNSVQPQHAAPAAEQQPRLVSHCAKCPARFVQQHSEVPHSNTELEQHLKCHCSAEEAANAPNTLAYSCEFCDFRAAHETLIQTHRYVHSQHYQDKCAARYKSCREDVAHAAPKLMQITLTKNLQSPETVWIVDLDLSGNELKQQQLANCSSLSNLHASTSNFEGGNSLLKKQLEAGPAPIPTASSNLTRNCSPSPQAKAQPDADDSCSNTHSTSASVATSDLAADAGSDFASATASPAPLEKCLHCPYESNSATAYKAHLQHHICISQQKQAYTCEHCDYSVPQQQQIEEHTRVHFNAMEKLKSVAFFTSYDNLELSVKQEAREEQQQQHADTTNLEHTENVSIKQEQAQEHNNNNEEDAVNENMLQEQQQEKAIEKSDAAAQQATDEPQEKSKEPAAAEAQKKTCTKIILYKNDGCLSIKKDGSSASVTSNNNNSVSGDNISDRLRRRISRSSNSHHLNLNGVSSNDEHHHPHQNHTHTHSHHHQPPQQQQSHKTILVNAKTGQVISRN